MSKHGSNDTIHIDDGVVVVVVGGGGGGVGVVYVCGDDCSSGNIIYLKTEPIICCADLARLIYCITY